MIVIDTSVVLAFMNAADQHHPKVAAWMDATEDELATTPLVVAELDHLVGTSGGAPALDALYEDFESGAYQVEWWPQATRESIAVARRYRDLELGLTDASLVALAARLDTDRIATLDERHFRAVPPLTGQVAFALLPADRQ